MKEQHAEDLLSYLRELHLSGPGLTSQVLESPGFETAAIRGCTYPETDRLQFSTRIDKLADGTFEAAAFNVKLLEISKDNSDLPYLNRLEDRLKAAPWDLAPDELLKHPGIDDLIGEVLVLKKNEPETASLLMAKYWSDTPMEKMPYFEPSTTLFSPKELEVTLSGNYTDLDLMECYNLFKGRAVMKSELKEGSLMPEAYWLVLEGKDLLRVPGYDIDAQVRQVSFAEPLNTDSFTELMTQLYKGEQITTRVHASAGRMQVRMQADPKNNTLGITDMGGGLKIPLEEITAKKEQKIKPAKTTDVTIAAKGKRRGPHL